MRHVHTFPVVLAVVVAVAATPARALPNKEVIDEDGVPLRDVAFVLRSIKGDGWTPAKPIIDKLTVVMMVPVTKDGDGHRIDRYRLAQSQVGKTETIEFKGHLAKQKIDSGMKPIVQPAPHMVVIDHPVPVDEAQTIKNLRIVVHAAKADGRVTLLIRYRGALRVMRAPATVVARIAVDESRFFSPTKTHALSLEIPGERVRGLTDGENALLARPGSDPAAFVRLIDALTLTGDARTRALDEARASGRDQPSEPASPVASGG